jgi:Ser/Thr protein kinase RdoA (MazF antagonist)
VATGVHLGDLLNELPNQRDQFLSAFELFNQHTAHLPVVLTHGDFNPFNLFPNQVIDFGASFRGPVGYDVVSNIFHVYYFPPSDGYEMKRLFDFSPEQVNEYLQYFDQVFIEHGLPAMTLFLNDFIFARMVWSVVRMHRTPLLQSWRYDLITKTVTDYLQGQDLQKNLLNA